MGFHQLVQKLGHSKKQVTPNTFTLQEIQNEWSCYGFSSTCSKVWTLYETVTPHISTDEEVQSGWSYCGFHPVLTNRRKQEHRWNQKNEQFIFFLPRFVNTEININRVCVMLTRLSLLPHCFNCMKNSFLLNWFVLPLLLYKMVSHNICLQWSVFHLQVLKRSSGRTNDTPRSPVSVSKSSGQIETSVASKRQFQQTKTQTLHKTARQTSLSTSQEQQDDHSKKSHEPLIVVKKEPLDYPDCNSCPFAGNATTSITGNTFASCANNHEASSNPRNCANAVPLRTIPPNPSYAVQYPQHPLMTQPNFQALQSKVQVPLSPGYAFPYEESRVSAPRISQQASVIVQ